MDERIIQFRVGVVVLGTLIATVTLGLLFGELPALVRDTYTIRIRFDDAPGVTKDTPVHKSGILIGRVSEVDFAPDNDGVIVTAEIDADRKIPRTDVCRISKSLLGDARVEFISPSALGRPTPTEPAGEASLNGSVVRPPLRFVQPVSFQQSGRTELVGQPALPKPKAGADVYLPEYRLAPEHPYPAATDDVFSAYRQMLERGHDPSGGEHRRRPLAERPDTAAARAARRASSMSSTASTAPSPISSAAEMATGVPKPAAPSRNVPKLKAISRACILWSGEIAVTECLTISNAPVRTVN